MDILDIKKFKRDKKIISSLIKITDNNYIAKEDLFIMLPKKFIELHIGDIDNTVTTLSVLAVFNKDLKYGVINIPAMVKITPDSIDEVEVGSDTYYKLTISKGNSVIDSRDVVIDGDIGYNVFNIMLVKGVVPWYINYLDLVKIFENIPKYTGTKLESYMSIVKIMIALSARSKDDPNKPYRYIIKKSDEVKDIHWVGLNNIYYTYNSTASKVFGSYMKAGMISAIVNPETKPTKLENLVRK